MNFYLSAVDDLLRREGDAPSIGVILCKTKDNVVAEYALRDVKQADRGLHSPHGDAHTLPSRYTQERPS